MGKEEKGETSMNAYAIKPTLPFVTKKTIERTPMSANHKERIEFIDSHNFSLKVDKETGALQCKIEKK